MNRLSSPEEALAASRASKAAAGTGAVQTRLWLRVLDDLGVGCMVFNTSGTLLDETFAVEALLEGSNAASVKMKAKLHRVAVELARQVTLSLRAKPSSVTSLESTIQSPNGRHSLRALVLAGDEDDSTTIIITLRRIEDEVTRDASFFSHYGLTAREAQVARLLEAGCSGDSIAQALGVSIHTARRHTERVMMKLQVKSRAAVGARLREHRG